MSSNHPHINITRSNYEDFFLLYVDGELTPEECDAVETFAATHPDLQEELDILLTTRLDAEPVVFGDKDILMADSMKVTAIDESLLSYIDNELSPEEKAGVEWELAKNKDLQAQHQLLQQTKLDPNETIVYPYKEELYRRTEKAVRPMYWLRAAAVVTILLGWGSFWYMDNYGTAGPEDKIALAPPAATTTPVPTPAQGTTPTVESAPLTETTPSGTETTTEPYTPIQQTASAALANSSATRTRADYREPVAEPLVVVNEVVDDVAVVTERPRVETVTNPSSQSSNNEAVTIKPAATYNTIDVPTGEDPAESIAKGDSDKKGSMRGFLRKTARFIERRTGIDPTNEGDELMIGALTINLK